MTNKKQHRVCFGMTLYNNAKHLPETIESLLGQTYEDFNIIVLDDCSTDQTDEIMKQYEARDKRIYYSRNNKRSGMITTWRNVFYKALEIHNPDYFAWASDHDKWHPEWLEHHVNALDEDLNVVLAYPETGAISQDNETITIEQPPPFDTCEMSKLDRFYNVCKNMKGAGNKVYGLFRVAPLIKSGVFRYQTLPDKLLITEISIYGSLKYIPRKLWYRRYFGPVGTLDELIKDQKNKLFEPSSVPFHADFPHIAHSLIILSASTSEEPSNLWSRLLLSMMYWEDNKRKNIRRQLTDLDNSLKSHSGGEETLDPSSNFLQVKSLPLIRSILRSMTGNDADDTNSDSNINNLLTLETIMLYHHANTEALFEETKQETKVLLEKLALANAKIKRAMVEAENAKAIADKSNSKAENALAKAEYWKQHATSRFGYAFVQKIKKTMSKEDSDE